MLELLIHQSVNSKYINLIIGHQYHNLIISLLDSKYETLFLTNSHSFFIQVFMIYLSFRIYYLVIRDFVTL